MQPVSNEELYNFLRDLNILGLTALDQVYSQARNEKIELATLLVDQDLITDANMGKAISELLSMQFVELGQNVIDTNILNTLPEIVARKHNAICFGHDATGLKICTNEPRNREFFAFLGKKTGEKINIFYATKRDVDAALSLYKQGLVASFEELLKEQVGKAETGETEEPISKIFELLIEYSYTNKASDIHIEPGEINSIVRFRIDGILHDVLKIPSALHEQLTRRVKVLSRLPTDEYLSAQDGKLQVKLPTETLDVRVSIVPITTGEKIVLRLLSSKAREFGLKDLGLSDHNLERVMASFTKPYGMILSTGPTGSGKTTTIYAIIKILNTRDKNIATIEDPVEYEISGVNQIQVNPKTNLTFAAGLRSILRQDPNIIFVGEIRDEETAGIAVNSAMTGHLVLSTLHTNDAAGTLPRLLDMNIEPFLAASTINLIIGQRLIRKICEACRSSVVVPKSDLSKQFSAEFINKHFATESVRVYKGKGCKVCHDTGYIGRVGLFEVLTITPAIQKLIEARADSETIRQLAITEGMVPMIEDGVSKVFQGITTIEELLRATKE